MRVRSASFGVGTPPDHSIASIRRAGQRADGVVEEQVPGVHGDPGLREQALAELGRAGAARAERYRAAGQVGEPAHRAVRAHHELQVVLVDAAEREQRHLPGERRAAAERRLGDVGEHQPEVGLPAPHQVDVGDARLGRHGGGVQPRLGAAQLGGEQLGEGEVETRRARRPRW